MALPRDLPTFDRRAYLARLDAGALRVRTPLLSAPADYGYE